jgi:D-alanyl-D-alanine carboxypeptidase
MPAMDRHHARRVVAALLATAAIAAPMAPPVAAESLVMAVTSPPPGFRAALASLIAEQVSVAPGAGDHPTQVAGGPDARTAARALPACRYLDQLTRYRKVKEWRKTLVDTNLRVKRYYRPSDLVSVSRAGLRGGGSVRKVMLDDLTSLANAARRKGKPLAVRSAYRSYQTQVATFASWVSRSGYEAALRFSARPGHSEHQLGTAVDFTTAPGVPLSTSFGASPAGKWLAKNSWRFGFLMSYPKGKQRLSCYGYEPWHFRYVGRDLARRIHASGDVPRVYFWEHFETAP